MSEYLFLAVELALFVLYPLKKTYLIWKKEDIDTNSYRETVVYWMFFASFQALSWNFDANLIGVIRILLIITVMFFLPKISNFLFRANSKKKKNN